MALYQYRCRPVPLSLFSIEALVYCALAFGILAFLLRDELRLRLLYICSLNLYILYYYFAAEAPLWAPIFANGALIAANLLMIGIIVTERSTIGMSAADREFFRSFPLMKPGQFRVLRRVSRDVEGPVTMVTQGAPVTELFFICEGRAEVDKSGQRFPIGPDCFVGEVAFISGTPASATVHLEEGARAVCWSHADLTRLFRRKPSLRVALLAHLNEDLARKVAASSQPAPAAGQGSD